MSDLSSLFRAGYQCAMGIGISVLLITLCMLTTVIRAADGAAVEPVALPRLTPAPESVNGLDNFHISLDGTWSFNPTPPQEFWKQSHPDWKPIQVPGEWEMQGFTVAKDHAAGYTRSFTLPANWAGQRIKWRCDAVYSDAVVYINGQEAGRHLGGFTPFELDVTNLLQPGHDNQIALAVTNESMADTLASGSQYAAHPMGGILRKMYLLALPTVNVASLQTTTQFDATYHNATLRVELAVANEGTALIGDAQAIFELTGPDHQSVAIAPTSLHLPALAAGQTLQQLVEIPVAAPAKWDPEHPNLYVLHCRLQRGSSVLENVDRRFGFRQVEVRGNQLFVNNLPVKLRGVCRHEVHPLLGRSLTPELWHKDVELYRACNCNYIRTSHYPPAEEFIDACDELGLFVESEAGLCWVQHNANPIWQQWNYKDWKFFNCMLQANLEKMQVQRSHPSVIIWSLGNESRWSPLWAEIFKRVQALDPTRPVTFHDQCWGNYNNAHSTTTIGVYHYPGLNGPAACAKESRPILFGEYCHLNAYNRREQIGDPGLRDVWGLGLERMWEEMRTSPGCLGGSIWAAMDDTFFLPDGRTVGYGTWGPLDGWRRTKPEYWHVTKAYSPVRILETEIPVPAAGQPILLTVENRSDFANLNEFTFVCNILNSIGSIKTTAAAPGQKGTLSIPALNATCGQTLTVYVNSPRGFMVDAYRFTIGGENIALPSPVRAPAPLELQQDAQTITIIGHDFRYTLDTTTGQLRAVRAGDHDIPLEGPCLTLVALDAEGGGTQLTGKEPTFTPLWGLCTNWKASAVTVDDQSRDRKGAFNDRSRDAKKTLPDGRVSEAPTSNVVVKVTGAYDQAAGEYDLTFDGTGRLNVAWKFTLQNALNPRQTGITFTLPKNYDTLTWHRHGQWSWYPDDHIGRLAGTTKAFLDHLSCGLAGPRTQPTWPWSQDQNAYGCNDFRSTKFNIISAALTDATGTGLRAIAAADRHAHAWIDGDHARLLIADYANDGAEGFFQMTRAIPNRPIPKGGTINSTAQVELVEGMVK